MARQFNAPRRQKRWDVLPGLTVDLTADGTTAGGFLSLEAPVTVMRMLGGFLITPDPGGTFVAGDLCTIGIGICVVSTDAAGTASLPDPIGEPQYPWLYWTDLDLVMHASGDQAANIAGTVRREFDIRSMRKIKPRESLQLVVEYADTTGAPPIFVNVYQTRVLLAVA